MCHGVEESDFWSTLFLNGVGLDISLNAITLVALSGVADGRGRNFVRVSVSLHCHRCLCGLPISVVLLSSSAFALFIFAFVQSLSCGWFASEMLVFVCLCSHQDEHCTHSHTIWEVVGSEKQQAAPSEEQAVRSV